MIGNLEYELAHATKSHNDLITIYPVKLTAAGVPPDKLAFEPPRPQPVSMNVSRVSVALERKNAARLEVSPCRDITTCNFVI
jgi:hypothetical protein